MAWVVFPRSTPLDCCIIQIYIPNRTGRYTKYGILLLILSLIMIHNTIGLGLLMFIDATTSLQTANFNIFNKPLLIFACLYSCIPHLFINAKTRQQISIYSHTQLYSPNEWQIHNRNINKNNQHK